MFKVDNAWHVPTVPYGEFFLVVMGIYRDKDMAMKSLDARLTPSHTWPIVTALEIAEYLETQTYPDPLAQREGSSKWKPLVYLRLLQGLAGINPTWAVSDKLGVRFAGKKGFKPDWTLRRTKEGDVGVLVTYPNREHDKDSEVYVQRVKDGFSSLKLDFLRNIDSFSKADHRSPNAPAFTLEDIQDEADLPCLASSVFYRLLKRFPVNSPPLAQMVFHYMLVEGLAKGYWGLQACGIDGIELKKPKPP